MTKLLLFLPKKILKTEIDGMVPILSRYESIQAWAPVSSHGNWSAILRLKGHRKKSDKNNKKSKR